jgi:hypothetical protein
MAKKKRRWRTSLSVVVGCDFFVPKLKDYQGHIPDRPPRITSVFAAGMEILSREEGKQNRIDQSHKFARARLDEACRCVDADKIGNLEVS